MIAKNMLALGTNRSVIRDLFEYGNQRTKEIGRENIYDFSLGNPSVPAPKEVENAIRAILDEEDPVAIHGYTSACGSEEARKAIAQDLNQRYHTCYSADELYLTCGAAASLISVLRALMTPETPEIICAAPFFPEYRCFVEANGGQFRTIPAQEGDFQIDFQQLENALSEKTTAFLINTPNNPSGAVYSEETLRTLAELLENKGREYHHPIYLISDEPYRELTYEGTAPFPASFYRNTVICYSYSKSLSLPGERIGYLVIPDEAADSENLIAAANVATRILGFVNAPTLQQKIVKACLDEKTDISFYDRNRETLYNGLKELGFECIKPEGAFYLFVKSPVADEKEFCAAAKKYNILVVPGSSFACPGYVRIAYCVAYETIVNSLPKFAELAEEYK